ncbi:F0F1 ATP synthase subunit A [Candidatus Gottesmanbacteria bacterium]|nr:F0F1 ATP synthase subunit A [Candidatus Gottesmanbacteria bacterium]
MGIHISLSAETITQIGTFLPVTNSLLTTWLVMVVLTSLALIVRSKIIAIPGVLQSIFEIAVEGLFTLFESVLGEKTRRFYPFLATLFFFIILMNWVGLLPGVGTIGLEKITHGEVEFIPLFRAGTADLNTTLALALITFVYIEYAGISALGLSYLKKFFNFSNPIYFFVGILELISELSRIVSYSFRLFGNVFAGEVLLTVIAFFVPLLAPLPFLGLELFVGFIQAMVFAMLTAVFLSLATVKESH